MTLLKVIIDQLASWPPPRTDGANVIVPTHCLYSSGTVVRVTVSGRSQEFVVHDDGRAIEEFTAAGAFNEKSIGILRAHFRDVGVQVTKTGAICSPHVRLTDLAPTIALIANASQEAEDLLLLRWKPRLRRNFKRTLGEMLEAEFPHHIKPEIRVSGASQKQHRFDFAVDREEKGLILVDAVHNEANAISSAVLRNLDVGRTDSKDIQQRIVFDDSEEWRAEDIALLKMGATVIPLSQAAQVLTRLAA